jgi:hypothetical protein
MRNTLVTTLSASMLMVASLVAMPSNAQSQVVIIIGNGTAQPYYPQPYPPPYPYPQPYPRTHVLYGGGFYPGYYGGVEMVTIDPQDLQPAQELGALAR